MVVNFTGNDTVVQFSNYLGEGMLGAMGSYDMVGLVLMLVLVLVCYFAHLPLDASAFLVFFAIMILGLNGLLPPVFFAFALLLTGLVAAWFIYKITGQR